MAQYELRQSFTVPATSGNYATEEIVFVGGNGQPTMPLSAVTALVESLPTGAAAELWLPKVGVASPGASDYLYTGFSLTGAGSDTWPLAGYRGAKIRVKSGGTAGTAIVSATGD